MHHHAQTRILLSVRGRLKPSAALIRKHALSLLQKCQFLFMQMLTNFKTLISFSLNIKYVFENKTYDLKERLNLKIACRPTNEF